MKKRIMSLVSTTAVVASVTLPSTSVKAFDETDLNNLMDMGPRGAAELLEDTVIVPSETPGFPENNPDKVKEELEGVAKEVSTIPTYKDKEGNILNPETAGKVSTEVAPVAPGEEVKPEMKPEVTPVTKVDTKKGDKVLPKTSAVK